MINNKEKRIFWIDNMKGISMICVMIGHFNFFPSIFTDWYAPFFLSAFLFASGYTFRTSDNFRVFLLKKSKTILFPWLWMGVLVIGSRLILSFNSHGSIIDEFGNFFLQIRGKGDEGWFFTCLFGSELFFYFLVKYCKSSYILIGTSLMLSLVSGIYSVYLKGSALPWHIQSYGAAIFFLMLGYMYNRYQNKLSYFINKKVLSLSLLLYIVITIIDYIEGWQTITFYSFGDSLLKYYLWSMIAIIMIVLVSNYIPKTCVLMFIGQNTLLYYGLHGKFISVIQTILFKITGSEMNLIMALFGGIFGICLVLAILCPIIIIINNKMRFLLGRM